MHTYQGNFEVHLTVQSAGDAPLDRFRRWCHTHACKCVRIVLAQGAHVEQPMATYHRHATTLPTVLAEAHDRAAALQNVHFTVLRLKVEADPDNEGVPEHDADTATQPPTNYFEHHVKLLRDVSADRGRLLQTCLQHGAHLLCNAWHEPSHGKEERFVTLRCHRAGRQTSRGKLLQLLASLHEAGETVIEIESEYSVHDSNLNLDAGWLPQSP